MGWAGAAYQYGILATHWYWVGAIPAMLFPGRRDDALLLHLQDALGPRLPAAALRRGARSVSALTFGFMTVLMSGINMLRDGARHEGRAGLDIHFSIWVSSLTVAAYVVLGGCCPRSSTRSCSSS